MYGNRCWRADEPEPSSDVVVVGGGGHGPATAYYLAANHGSTDVCVVEKVGSGGHSLMTRKGHTLTEEEGHR